MPLGYARHVVQHWHGKPQEECRDKVVGFFGRDTIWHYHYDEDCWLPEAFTHDAAGTVMTDHLGRDDKDFAIEFGEYLAQSAELLLITMEDPNAGIQTLREGFLALKRAIYEFRKRAAKVK